MSTKEMDDEYDEELTQEDTWSVVSAFFDEFQMVRNDDDDFYIFFFILPQQQQTGQTTIELI